MACSCCSPSFDCCYPDERVRPPLEISVSFAWSNLIAIDPYGHTTCFLNDITATYVLQSVNYNQSSHEVTYQGAGSNGIAITYVWSCSGFVRLITQYKSNKCSPFYQCFNTQFTNLVGQEPRHEGLCAAREHGFSTTYTLNEKYTLQAYWTEACVAIGPGQLQFTFDSEWTMTPL